MCDWLFDGDFVKSEWTKNIFSQMVVVKNGDLSHGIASVKNHQQKQIQGVLTNKMVEAVAKIGGKLSSGKREGRIEGES